MVNTKTDIEKTAATLVDLVESGVKTKNGRAILKKLRVFSEIISFAPQIAGLVASRYLTSQTIINEYLVRGYKPNVIELGAGFSPPATDLSGKVSTYIELDLSVNSEMKKRIIKQIRPNDKTKYIAGDAFSSDTWKKIKKLIDPKQPTIVFGEGFFIYTTKDQRKKIAKEILPLIGKGGCLFFEDSIRYHPEWKLDSKLQSGINGIIQTSKSVNYNQKISQEELTQEWKSYGFQVTRRPAIYIKTNEDVAKKFRTWVLSLK